MFSYQLVTVLTPIEFWTEQDGLRLKVTDLLPKTLKGMF